MIMRAGNYLLSQQQQNPGSDGDIRTLWIGNLQPWMDEFYIMSIFAQPGAWFQAQSAKVIRNKGYGFIEFANHGVAAWVLQAYNGTQMPSCEQTFRLNWAQSGAGERRQAAGPEYTIFVGNLAPEVSDYVLTQTFKSVYPSVKGAKVVTDRTTGRSKGYGFVRFWDEGEQMRAMTEMIGQYCWTRPMRIAPADNKQPLTVGPGMFYIKNLLALSMFNLVSLALSSGFMQYNRFLSLLSRLLFAAMYQDNQGANPGESDPSNTTILVGAVDVSATDDESKSVFGQCGELGHAEIPPGKSCGFAESSNRASAEHALSRWDGQSDRAHKKGRTANAAPFSGFPTDLVEHILAGVPGRSTANFGHICREWRSILAHPNFKKSFLTRGYSFRRLLLLTFRDNGQRLSFSSPLDSDGKNSLVLSPYRPCPRDLSDRVGCPQEGFITGRVQEAGIAIWNPLTTELVSLPEVELMSGVEAIPFLGYDPTDVQFKVLCIKATQLPYVNVNLSMANQGNMILTLGNGQHLWRSVNSKPHHPLSKGVCIEGTLYYTAGVYSWMKVSMVVCFDIRSEVFRYIDIEEGTSRFMNSSSTLVNYKGKLGALQFTFAYPKRLELWVLEKSETWSTTIYEFPESFGNIVEQTELTIVGMDSRDTDTVLLAPHFLSSPPFYIYYFGLQRCTVTRVEIQGFGKVSHKKVDLRLGYIENLKTLADYGN
ncbi:unnamed protein product [Microthlaspi erraticum]|uniref:RRM domain-containing protein n=1 Tax=Microthlaspi erraticum TaxID=1685480 RepID=A0A6D2IL62_9BRAS|nr:unnamed protein product [Microthlaspi erraticum]CAA7056102.1 unnamed protein product [Microthlaspi erraticum]